MNKKAIFYTIVIIFLILLTGYGIYYGIDQYTYAKDLGIINSSYLNKKQKSLKEKLQIDKLNSIPNSYKFIHNRNHLTEIKSEYSEIKPLYILQTNTQKQVSNLFDGKNDYSDSVTDNKLNSLLNSANKISNQKLQSKLIVNINTIDLWLNQTVQAVNVIENLAKKNNIDFDDYVQAQANYSLIKNQHQKEKCKNLIKQIKQKYNLTDKNNQKNYQQRLHQEINAAKKQAESKYSHTPANITVTVISKKEQKLSKMLTNANINSSKAIILNENTLYLLSIVNDNYYKIYKEINISSTPSISSDSYSVKLTINAGQNGSTNYSIDNKGALILNNSDSKYSQYSVLNIHDNDFNSPANYLSLNNGDKYILFTNGDKYLLLGNNSNSDSNSDNIIPLSNSDLNSVIGFINENTKILVE